MRAQLIIRKWERVYIEPGHAQPEYVQKSAETIIEGECVKITPSGFCVIRLPDGQTHRSKKYRLLDGSAENWEQYGKSAIR